MGYCCRIFTPVQPVYPAASVRDFLSGALIATPGGYRIMGQGVYEDDLVKVNGEWKIRHRRVKNDHLVSDPAKLVGLADRDVAPLLQALVDTAEDLTRRSRKK